MKKLLKEEKNHQKTKTLSAFSKIIDAFAMDEVQILAIISRRKYLHPSSSLFMRNL
jgi:hypothetical protein